MLFRAKSEGLISVCSPVWRTYHTQDTDRASPLCGVWHAVSADTTVWRICYRCHMGMAARHCVSAGAAGGGSAAWSLCCTWGICVAGTHRGSWCVCREETESETPSHRLGSQSLSLHLCSLLAWVLSSGWVYAPNHFYPKLKTATISK